MLGQKDSVGEGVGNMADVNADIASYMRFVHWCAQRTRLELEELDKYAQEKIRDLVRKFHTIAESANHHTKQAIDNKAKETILIGDRVLTYAQAISELDRMTAAVAEGGIMTDKQYQVRDQIKVLSRAIYQHAQTHEKFTQNTLNATNSINTYIREIIVAFQFQDFVKQRMEHISIVMSALEKGASVSLEVLEAAMGDDMPQTVPDAMAQELLDKFFLSAVKDNFMAGLDPATASQMNVKIEADDDDVVLF